MGEEQRSVAVEVIGSRATGWARGEEYWRQQVAAWKRSGVSQVRFCREQGLSRYSFGHWKVKLEGPGRRGGARFVRVGGIAVGGSDGQRRMRLTVKGRYSVEIPEQFEAGTLRRLLDVLEGR